MSGFSPEDLAAIEENSKRGDTMMYHLYGVRVSNSKYPIVQQSTKSQPSTAASPQDNDDVPENPREIQVLSKTKVWHPIKVYQDTGSESNWISPRVQRELDLESSEIPKTGLVRLSQHVEDFNGRLFMSSNVATLSWQGLYGSGEDDFYVGPEGLPVDMLVGRLFLNRFPKDTRFDQFSNPRNSLPSPVVIVVTKKPTKSEKDKAKAASTSNAATRANLVEDARRDRELERQRKAEQQQSQSASGSSSSGSNQTKR